MHRDTITFVDYLIRHAETDNIAIVDKQSNLVLTYGDLITNACRIADYLNKHFKYDRYVVLNMYKSADYICALLGTWFASKAFVPIGVDVPADRVNYITDLLSSSGDCNCILNTADIDNIIKNSDIQYTDIIKDPYKFITPPKSEDVAYMIFSSGTTGNPKGIKVKHSGLINLAKSQSLAFGMSNASNMLWIVSLNFDASMSDILTTFYCFSTLVIENRISDMELAQNMFNVIEQNNITIIDIPPSLLKLYNPSFIPISLECVVIGGECADTDTVHKWVHVMEKRDGRVVNVYGPTEATICSSLIRCDENWNSSCIGTPLNGVEYYVGEWHEDINQIITSSEGELIIGGACVASGYYNNPELTDKKFVRYRNSINGQTSVLYRTGDKVRVNDDGTYMFIGRLDRQVKINGQLVEPEEIENIISSLPVVKRCAVVVKPYPTRNSSKSLVAYISVEKTENMEGIQELIHNTVERMTPKYMHPSNYIIMPDLPLTVTGKVDIPYLTNLYEEEVGKLNIDKDTSNNSDIGITYADHVDMPLAISAIMSEILNVPVDTDDSFFDCGADSIETLILISRLENELGITLNYNDLRKYAKPIEICSYAENNNVYGDGISRSALSSEWGETYFNAQQNISCQNNILITGATGFLGSQLLKQLIEKNKKNSRRYKITCLVHHFGGSALIDHWRKMGIDPSGIDIVIGDITKPKFGMSAEDYEILSRKIHKVFHCAAAVNMLADYETLKPANVEGVKNIIDFCKYGMHKVLAYASTLSVFVSTDKNTGTVYETDTLTEETTIYGGYAQTKYVAEQLLFKSDLDVAIFRFGLLTGSKTDYISAPKDFLSMFFKGAQAVGTLPAPNDRTKTFAVDITPVDDAVTMMLDVMSSLHITGRRVFHIASEMPLYYDNLVNMLSTMEIIEQVPYSQWLIDMKKAAEKGDNATVLNALKMGMCRFDEDMFKKYRYMDLFQTTDIKFDMTNTYTYTTHKAFANNCIIINYISNALTDKK